MHIQKFFITIYDRNKQKKKIINFNNYEKLLQSSLNFNCY